MKFRKKPVVVEAWQYLGGDLPTGAPDYVLLGARNLYSSSKVVGLAINTVEGQMRANPGDWIIKGVSGEIYPCKPRIFEATYERVEE